MAPPPAATATPPLRRPMEKAAAALRWLYLVGAGVVLYCFQAALWVCSFGTARVPPRLPMHNAVAALRWLYFLGADLVVYGSLAAFWAGSIGGAVAILGRWVCCEGSAVSNGGEAVFTCSLSFVMPLLPGFFTQFMMRGIDSLKFEAEEKKREREKLASSTAIAAESAQGQHSERNGPWRLSALPHVALLLLNLIRLGIQVKDNHAKGTLGWKIGSVLFDVTCLASAALVGLFAVPKMVILAIRFPARRIGLL